jgi:uncharacterized Zn-binding protein involved in type VI secretion
MSSVGIHPPKTPVTTGSNGIAKATLPNVCKLPGPPAPFVPGPLPNIAKSGSSPNGFSTTVKIEGNTVAIRGATFESMGDMASKGTGGGLISANTHGPAKFITPGSLTVKIEGKNVHLLSDSMLNNCGPSGSPPNTGATMAGVTQANQGGDNPIIIDCKKGPPSGPFTKCEKEEICAKCADVNSQAQAGKLKTPSDTIYENNRRLGDNKCAVLNNAAQAGKPTEIGTAAQSPGCKGKAEAAGYKGYSPDHIQEIQLGGHPTAAKNLRWMSSKANEWMGRKLQDFKTSDPNKNTGVKPNCCP